MRELPQVVIDAQTVDCPKCGAPAGQPCLTPRGWYASWPHSARLQIIEAQQDDAPPAGGN